jgi:hypothetical protein
MVGVITEWDILAHPVATIRCFGWQVFFKAIAPWQGKTFFSLLQPAASPKAETSNVPSILERCIALELRAKRIYGLLAKALDDQGLAGPFFAGLVKQEQCHVDLLELCRAAAIRKDWRASEVNPWLDCLPRLEHQMALAEAAVSEIDSIDAALQLVIQIESSKITQVFNIAFAATDAAFIKRLKPFRKAMEAHMSYIVERLPELSPNLILPTRGLRAVLPKVRSEPQ